MINKTLTSFMREEVQRKKQDEQENNVELHHLANDEQEGPIETNITPISPSNDEEAVMLCTPMYTE